MESLKKPLNPHDRLASGSALLHGVPWDNAGPRFWACRVSGAVQGLATILAREAIEELHLLPEGPVLIDTEAGVCLGFRV